MKWYAFFESVLMQNLYYHTGKCELSDIDNLITNKKGNFGDNFTVAEMLVTLYMDEAVISKFKILKNARGEVSDLFFEKKRSKEVFIKLSKAMEKFDLESESFKKLLSERLSIDNKPI